MNYCSIAFNDGDVKLESYKWTKIMKQTRTMILSEFEKYFKDKSDINPKQQPYYVKCGKTSPFSVIWVVFSLLCFLVVGQFTDFIFGKSTIIQ